MSDVVSRVLCVKDGIVTLNGKRCQWSHLFFSAVRPGAPTVSHDSSSFDWFKIDYNRAE